MSKMPESDDQDFDLKYRPGSLDDVVGQAPAVNVIRGWKKVPRCVLLSGNSGCGKTTLARIVVNQLLKVGRMDLRETNCGVVESAIDMVREINGSMSSAPMGGAHRAWVLDEVQTLSRQKFAQEALLKVLEECPPHVYFFLCTTDPKRLLPAIRGRCEHIELQSIAAPAMLPLLKRIAKAEKITPPPDDRLLDLICDRTNGAARDAVKMLQKVAGIADPAERLAAVDRVGDTKVAFELAQELLPFKGGAPNWAGVCKVLAGLKDEDPESIRQVILATARAWLIKPNSKIPELAAKVIAKLDEPFFDRNSGHALLALACYRIVVMK